MLASEEELAMALEWLCENDTGRSSKAIMVKMLGGSPPSCSHPSDPADLGRCIRLLDQIKAWRPRIQVMATVSPEWDFICRHWQDLEHLYGEESPSGRCPRTFLRMKKLISDGVRSDPERVVTEERDGLAVSWSRKTRE